MYLVLFHPIKTITIIIIHNNDECPFRIPCHPVSTFCNTRPTGGVLYSTKYYTTFVRVVTLFCHLRSFFNLPPALSINIPEFYYYYYYYYYYLTTNTPSTFRFLLLVSNCASTNALPQTASDVTLSLVSAPPYLSPSLLAHPNINPFIPPASLYPIPVVVYFHLYDHQAFFPTFHLLTHRHS